jgi:cobalamin synthase
MHQLVTSGESLILAAWPAAAAAAAAAVVITKAPVTARESAVNAAHCQNCTLYAIAIGAAAAPSFSTPRQIHIVVVGSVVMHYACADLCAHHLAANLLLIEHHAVPASMPAR